MDRNVNFNIQASDYVPINKRNQYQGQKYDNSGLEVVYQYQGQSVSQGSRKNQKKNYSQGYNQGYNQGYGNNQNQGYDNYNTNSGSNNYNKYNTQDYNQGYDNSNYYSSNQQKGKKKAQGKGKKQTSNQGYSQGYGQDYSQGYTQSYDQGYNQGFNQLGYTQNYSKNKGGSKQVYVIEKDVSDVKQVDSQDIQDDLYADDTFGGETYAYSELTGDFEEYGGEEDYLYGQDYGGGIDDDFYVEDPGHFEDEFTQTTNKFSQMKVGGSQGKGGNFGAQSPTYSKTQPMTSSYEDEQSKKHQLIFSNKEGFTNYVEEIMKKERRNYGEVSDSFVNVLMIAEKPSIAKSISEALGGKINQKRMGKGGCLINFDGYFGNSRARFTVSSVMGHVYTSDFQRIHNDWNSVDYLDLYDVPVAKIEANKKTRIPSTLQRLAQGKDILCLWLDCDKEGENICYEVIYNCYPFMNKKNYQQVYRAKFSSLTKQDLKSAFNKIRDPPNKNESLSVDARQVIDLKIGVSFTRFLTSAILPGIKKIGDTKFLSYGPCQTPTLWFCVDRQKEIDKFKPREYKKVHAEIELSKIKYKVPYRKKFFDQVELRELVNKIKDSKTAKVVNVFTKENSMPPPAGLNTVHMLRTASSYLRMSPHETMVVAEKLYTMGYITYPRTETTKYASSYDFYKTLNDYSSHPVFGKPVTALMKNFRKPILRGVDVGDHPPITPSRVAAPSDLKGDQWRLYEFICTHFFASISEPAEYEEKTFQIDIGGEIFEAESKALTKEGYLAFMSWKKSNFTKDFPVLKKDSTLPVVTIATVSHWEEPKENLTESDLIEMMEHNKIGTDASMPVHIENICQRGYVKVDASRKLIPTKLGIALIDSLSAVDPEIVKPTIRAEIENYVEQVAKGNKKYEDVLSYAIQLYKKKFLVVRQYYDKILNTFNKYFEIDLMEMNKVYKTIKSKNEALKLQTMVKKE